MKGKEKGKGEDSDVGGDAAAAAGPNVGGPDACPNVGGVADDAEATNQLGGGGDESPWYPSSPEVLDGDSDEDESEDEPDEHVNDSEHGNNR